MVQVQSVTLQEYKKLYKALVEDRNDKLLRVLLTNVSKIVQYGKPTKSQKEFYEYLWSFNRSTGKNYHKLTNDILGPIKNKYDRERSAAILRDQQRQQASMSTSRLPKLKRIRTT